MIPPTPTPFNGEAFCPTCTGLVRYDAAKAEYRAVPWMHAYGPGAQVTHCGCVLCGKLQKHVEQTTAVLVFGKGHAAEQLEISQQSGDAWAAHYWNGRLQLAHVLLLNLGYEESPDQA